MRSPPFPRQPPVPDELDMPNLNVLSPLDLSLTDATGSGSDLVRVKVYRA